MNTTTNTTTNTTALLAYCNGIINDPDPNTGHVMFDEFQCNTCEGSGEIADPDAFDPWAEEVDA